MRHFYVWRQLSGSQPRVPNEEADGPIHAAEQYVSTLVRPLDCALAPVHVCVVELTRPRQKVILVYEVTVRVVLECSARRTQ